MVSTLETTEMTETTWKQQEMTESDRGDQELSKTFSGLKIGPLIRKLQAFKVWSLFGF